MNKPSFLKKKLPARAFTDAFERQLKELFIVENPILARDKKTAWASKEFKDFTKSKRKEYVYIHFPWLQTIVKSVRQEDYARLKTNRNINLISPSDQEKLRNYKIAVLGMSVGSNIAYLITQAGISNQIILADFDQLDTTNLNRIWGGVHQVGLNKAVIAARKIFEDNPYAKVTIWDKGVSQKDLQKYLKERKIDCIVEEVDSMPIKLMVRQMAKKYRVPVIMIADNGDGVVLTVERYDLGYKKFMEKPFSYWPKKMAQCKTPKDFADIVINDIVGGADKVDPRMTLSVKMIFEGKLVSWPQLGSAAMLGAVAATVAIKKIVRKEDKKKFRREYISVP